MAYIAIDETRLGYALRAIDSDCVPDSYEEWQQLWLDSVPSVLLELYGCRAFRLCGAAAGFTDTTVDLVGDLIAEPDMFPSGMAIWLETADKHTRVSFVTYHSPQSWSWVDPVGNPLHDDYSAAALVRGIAADVNRELVEISSIFSS